MKKVLFIFLYLFLQTSLVFAQGNCSDWEVKASKTEAKVGEEITISFFVTPKPNWYTYSTDFEEGGPQVTKFKFTPNPSYQLVGKVEAIASEKKFDDIFEMEVRFFKKRGEFRQKVKILKKDFQISGTVEYQTCSDKNGQCIPCEYDFNFKEVIVKADAKDETQNKENKDEKALNDKKNEENKANNTQEETAKVEEKTENQEAKIIPTADKKKITQTEPTKFGKQENKEESLWVFALGAFLAGLLALLTPCVYPMIPMTVTLFMKGDKPINPQASAEEQTAQIKANKRKGIIKALIYGGSIVGIYGLLGLVASLAFGAEFVNDFSTHWISNLLFFAVFIIFGMSFMGMFEIVLP
ncbi:MAG: protein-disulfide reductase DsbD domain-containing protein, partial [Raineya sp.]